MLNPGGCKVQSLSVFLLVLKSNHSSDPVKSLLGSNIIHTPLLIACSRTVLNSTGKAKTFGSYRNTDELLLSTRLSKYSQYYC